MIFLAFAITVVLFTCLWFGMQWVGKSNPIYAAMIEPTFIVVTVIFLWQQLFKSGRGGGKS